MTQEKIDQTEYRKQHGPSHHAPAIHHRDHQGHQQDEWLVITLLGDRPYEYHREHQSGT